MEANNSMDWLKDLIVGIKIDNQERLEDVTDILESNGYVLLAMMPFTEYNWVVVYPGDENDPMGFDVYGDCEMKIADIYYSQKEFIEKYGTSISKSN